MEVAGKRSQGISENKRVHISCLKGSSLHYRMLTACGIFVII
jgi:hypothetical protein